MELGLYVPLAGREVAEDMKLWDRLETDITHYGLSKQAVITNSVNDSELAFSVLVEGDNGSLGKWVAVGGVGGPKHYACIWLLTTPYVQTKPKRFIELSKQYIEELKALDYKKLYNYVHYQNKQTIRWLKYLGFQLEQRTGDELLIKAELDLWNL